jgi:hypothetical protein
MVPQVVPLDEFGGPRLDYPPPASGSTFPTDPRDRLDYLPPAANCWDQRVVGEFGEWFDNSLSNIPVIFEINDMGSGELFCFGAVRAGARQFGPAIWSGRLMGNYNKTRADLVVTGKYYVGVVNSDRTEGRIGVRDSCLEYVRNYGWYSKYPCSAK